MSAIEVKSTDPKEQRGNLEMGTHENLVVGSDHTPGPWHLETEFDGQYDVNNGHGTFLGINWGRGAPNVLDADDEATFQANARLIAAAPDLLEALEQALRESGCDGDLCGYRWHETARGAIRKATEAE